MRFLDFLGRGGRPRYFYAPDGGTAGGDPAGKEKDPAEGGKTYTNDEVHKMIAAERSKLKDDILSQLKVEKEEAERLAKLDEKTRLDEAIKKLKDEAAAAKRDKELLQLRYDTVGVLAKDNLPAEAVDLVLAGSAEETQKRIEALKSVLGKGIESAKPGWLKGETPPGMAPPGGKIWKLDEVQKLSVENPAEYDRHSKENLKKEIEKKGIRKRPSDES